MQQLHRKIISELNARYSVPPVGVVGVSGGADSMALLHVLQQVVASDALSSVIVAHVNYGLRGKESERDESHVRSYCKINGLNLIVHKVLLTPPQKGVQNWAREIRLDFFQRLAGATGVIFLGHNYDDLAESVLMRLSRGTAGSYLLGMRAWHGSIARPLLGFERSHIQSYISRHDIPTVHDSSNDKLVYSRNRVRHHVLPVLDSLFPGAKHKMVEIARDIEDLTDWSLSQLEQDIAVLPVDALPIAELAQLPRGVALLRLSTFFRQRVSEIGPVGRNLLLDIYKEISLTFGDKASVDNGGKEKRWELSPERFLILQEGFIEIRPVGGYGRYLQHKDQLRARPFAGFLPPGAKIPLSVKEKEYRYLRNTSGGTIHLRLEPVQKSTKIVSGEGKAFKAMPLLAQWQLKKERCKLLIVDGRPQALLSEGSIWAPNKAGEKILLEDWLVSIHNHEVLH